MAELQNTTNLISKDLILGSLEIKNFRAFKHLKIPNLNRINLITGKNGVGKSTLLEALWLYSSGANPNVVDTLLRMRNELSFKINNMLPAFSQSARGGRGDEWLPYLFTLFHNRPSIFDGIENIHIGPIDIDEDKQLSIGFVWHKLQSDGLGGLEDKIITLSKSSTIQDVFDAKPYLSLKAPGRPAAEFSFDNGTYGSLYWAGPDRKPLSYFVQSRGMNTRDIEFLWKRIALTSLEDDVLDALRLINPSLERISLLGEDGDPPDQIPFVKLKDAAEPVPLRSLGEGLTRLFAIVLVLVNAKDSLVMLDEIENGLHYSILGSVWQFIFEIARRHNVQVFATTHSWECVEAFQEAAVVDPSEGVLIRLDRRDGVVVPTTFDERRLTIATRDQIEVR